MKCPKFKYPLVCVRKGISALGKADDKSDDEADKPAKIIFKAPAPVVAKIV